MKHPMAVGFALGWLAYNYMLLVVHFTKQRMAERERKERANSNTVTVEMTREDYKRFATMPREQETKKVMGFARVLNSEETDNKDEEMA